jgi:hypothetical protein
MSSEPRSQLENAIANRHADALLWTARIPTMFLRFLASAVVGCALLAAPLAATAADRGPSTPEERKQALEYIHHFEADPLNPALKPEIQWVVSFVDKAPDLHIGVCPALIAFPKGDKKDGLTLFTAMLFVETSFVLQNPDKQDDYHAQFQAGVEGVLRIYEVLLKTNPKDRQPFLDDLIKRRDSGTLVPWVKDRIATFCKQ